MYDLPLTFQVQPHPEFSRTHCSLDVVSLYFVSSLIIVRHFIFSSRLAYSVRLEAASYPLLHLLLHSLICVHDCLFVDDNLVSVGLRPANS